MAWRHDRSPKRTRRWVIGLAVLVGLVGYGFALRNSLNSRSAQSSEQSSGSEAALTEQHVQGRYLLNGTVTWSRAVEREAGDNPAQPFSQLGTFDRDKYDAWTASLECPITDKAVSYQSQTESLLFNCPPRFLSEATKYFTIYDLANNHTYDQDGEAGLAETRRHLDEAGAQYFGTYDSSDSDDICDVIALPVRVGDDKATLPVAFCGWQYFGSEPVEGELDVMKQYGEIMPVFAFVEAGAEYQASADARQESVARQLIDRGADFVIINSPHWVQNTAVYKGKLIVYSMGNFIFDQLEAETNRSASIDVTMNIEHSDNVRKWLELGDQCKPYRDDCLAQAKQQGLQKITPAYTFDVVAGAGGYREITHKADETVQQQVEQRTNWAETCQKLGYNRCQ
jgi:hypothetical protein